MPKTIQRAKLDAVAAAVARSGPDGADLATLLRALPGLPRRSLQRQLARLVGLGRLHASGRARARHYHAISEDPADAPLPPADPHQPGTPNDDRLPTSAAGARLRQRVRRPLSQRTPVGFERSFLDAYEPNRSHYLSATLRAKLQQMGRSPAAPRPAGTYARQLLDRLLVDLSWASSRLEGNTYSRLDTQNLIEFGRYAEGKDRLEAQMILNHKAAIEMLVEGAEWIEFDRYTVQNLHALLAENLLVDAGAGGRLRTIDVAISGTVYHPTAIPQLIDECFDSLLAKARAIVDPFEQAFFVMVQLPYLQPFQDVNKRVSRIAANIPFIRSNLSPLSFVDVPEQEYIDGNLAVYELNRVELLRDVFVWAYERSCQRYTLIRQALPQPDPLRLRYRAALIDVVGQIVRTRLEATPDVIRRSVGGVVAAADMPEFVALVINELGHLHEGNIARYRLRLGTYREWKKRESTAR